MYVRPTYPAVPRPVVPLAVLLLTFALLVAGVLAPTRAHAAGTTIENLDVTYVLAKDGSMRVTETYTYRFDSPAHGPQRTVLTRQGYGDSRTQHREYPISDIRVSSPSGAPADLRLIEASTGTVIRVGDPDRTVTGTQRYVIAYTLGHVLNAQPQADAAELYWNVTGELPVPAQNVRVAVTGPAPATRAACTWGAPRSTDQCGSSAGATSTFTAGPLDPGQQMTVAEQMPLSAFGDLSPQLADGTIEEVAGGGSFISPAQAKALSYGGLAAGVGAPLLMLAGLGGLVWRRGRDERYVDIAPDIVPAPGEQVAVRRGGRRPVVAVRFTPPDDATPGLVGTIVDEQANTVDVSATVLDLAVRGFLRIEQVDPPGPKTPTDWRLTLLRDDDGTLLPYERTVLDGVFVLGTPVLMSQLRTHFAGTLSRAQSQMYSETVRRGWFRQSPQLTRQSYGWLSWVPWVLAAGLLPLTVMGAGNPDSRAGLDLPVPSAVIGIAGLVLAGVLGRLLARRMPARTATGSAVLHQSLGFREYLMTAEASQIAFDEAANVFSRYLPYAVVFGCADRWAKLFAEVASAAEAQGVYIEPPTFFVWYGGGYGGWGDFGSSVDSFATSAAGTFISTPGSSGGSAFGDGGGFGGFGDGGGFSGGGGGGGDMGSW